jgi:tetratricopeptide (TPR) repeat protein
MNTIKAGGLIYLAFFYVLLLAAKATVQQNTDTILKKAQAIYLTQPQRAISMIKNACRLAKIKNDNIGQVKSLNKLAVFFWESRRYDSARVYSRSGLLISEKFHIDSLQAESWMILGITDHSLSGYSAAIEKYEKAVSLYAKDNLSLHLGKAYLNIAICQMQLSAYEKSITTCFLAENYLLKSNDFKDAATTDNTIGSCFFALANYPKGIAYYKKALSTRMRLKENVLIAQSFNNLGDAFMQNNQPDSAIFYLGKSVSLYQREKNLDFLVLPLQNLGDSWKMKGNLNLASDYITRSLYIANELNMREEFARGNLDLAGIYIAREKFAEARAAANVSEKTAKSLKLPELLMNTKSRAIIKKL